MRRLVVLTLIAATLTLLIGLHLLRSFVTATAMYLYDAAGVPAPVAALCVLVPFGLAFLLHRTMQRLGHARAFVMTSAGVTLARIGEQISGSPPADLVLSMIGVALLLWFVPLAAGELAGSVDSEHHESRRFAVAVVLAIALDTALKGSFATMDVSWRRDWPGYTVVAVLCTANLVVLRALAHRRSPRVRPIVAPPTALVGLGPAIAIELLVLQNIGQQTVATGWSQEGTFLWMSTANAAAVALVWLLPLSAVGRVATAAAGGVLAFLVWSRPTGTSSALAQFLGVLLVAHLLLSVAVMMRAPGRHLAASRIASALGPSAAGVFAFVTIVLVYYAGYEIRLPFDRRLLLPAAALVLAAAAAWSGIGPRRTARPSWHVPVGVAAVSVLLVAVPVYRLAIVDAPEPVPGAGLPIRVMSYNLHQGFDPDGRPSIERVAEIIEREAPDVVALQEVSRAWLVAGSFDMLEWLSRRLDMPYVWGPAADDVWGNAVLSRFPMSRARTIAMPNNDEIVLDRSFTSVSVDVGGGDQLQVYVTHLHATRRDTARRVEQIEALIADGAGSTDTIVMGDLNFRAWDPEDTLLAGAGLRDAFEVTRRGSDDPELGLTTRANVRIDYIWVSSSLVPTGFTVGSEFASDHLPIAVTVSR